MQDNQQPVRSAFSIFINTVCEGTIPAWWSEGDYPEVYATELEAQREVVDLLQTRLQEFLDGERDFDDAITLEDFILPVEVWPDGSISTEDGSTFGKRS